MRPFMALLMLLLSAGCYSFPADRNTTCQSSLFSGWSSDVPINCYAARHNELQAEDILVFTYQLTPLYKFRGSFKGVHVYIWSTETKLRDACQFHTDGMHLWGCAGFDEIHLDTHGAALVHEMEHILFPLSGDHAGWNTNGNDAASLEYMWFRHHTLEVEISK